MIYLNQFHNCLSECKTRTIRFEKAPVIYTLGGRFPRARPQLIKKSFPSFS